MFGLFGCRHDWVTVGREDVSEIYTRVHNDYFNSNKSDLQFVGVEAFSEYGLVVCKSVCLKCEFINDDIRSCEDFCRNLLVEKNSRSMRTGEIVKELEGLNE